jgi:LPXTG-site transpeptidase (sortase) family protein
MRSKRWPAALGAAAGVVMITAGVAGLLASCSSGAPQPPPRGVSTVPTPSAVTSPASAPPSASPSPTGSGHGAVQASYPTPGVPAVTSSGALPVSLTIPVIGVKTSLLKLGLVTQSSLACSADPSNILHRGALDTCPLDSDPAAAGWYTGSALPGAIGPAVIAGHVDFPEPAVFWRLDELRTGDFIYVTLADRTLVKFRVTQVTSTPKTAFPIAAVYSDTPYAELRLITCDSHSAFANGHYKNNLIVYATEVT